MNVRLILRTDGEIGRRTVAALDECGMSVFQEERRSTAGEWEAIWDPDAEQATLSEDEMNQIVAAWNQVRRGQ